MRPPTSFERELGIALRSKLGSTTKVVRFADDEGANDVFIVSGLDCPDEGVTSYCSVGLSRKTQRAGDSDLKVEVLAACATATPHVDNLVASCVFDSVKNGSNIVYGSYISNILDQYKISDTLRHVTFVAPFLWTDVNKLIVESEVIYCLMMLPISEAEKQYLEQKGIDALEDLFNQKQIDIFNINRPCVLS